MTKRTLVLLAVTIVAAGLLVWAPWRSKEPPSEPADVAAAPPAPAEPPTEVQPIAPLARPIRRAAPRPDEVVAPVAAPALITNWPEKIDEILLSSEPESKKGEQLFEMLPNLPLDGQEQAVQHMVNLLSDEQFPSTARYLNDTNTPETVITLLMNDMLNRPDTVKLPMLFDLAQVSGHPLAEESKTILGIYVEKDFGDNWDEWRKGIEEYLKQEAAMNADGNAPAETPPVDPPPPAK